MRNTCLFSVILLCSSAVPALPAPLRILHTPPAPWPLGQDIVLTATADNPSEIREMEVKARLLGAHSYRTFLMTRVAAEFRASIPAVLLTQAGIDYYILARGGHGETATLPDTEPEKFPFHLAISLSSQVPPGIEVLSPAAAEPTESTMPEILLLFDPPLDSTALHLNLDGQDVTGDAEVRPDYLFYQPSTSLRAGPHGFALVSLDDQGIKQTLLSSSFTILGATGVEAISAHGSLTLGAQWAEANRDTTELSLPYPIGIRPSLNLSWFGEMGSASHSGWVSYDRNYDPQPFFSAELLPTRSSWLQLGDVYPTLSEITVDAISPFGLDASGGLRFLSLRTLALRTQRPDTLLGLYSQYLIGEQVQWAQEGHALSATYVRGFDDPGSLPSPQRLSPPVRNDLFAGAVSLPLLSPAVLQAQYVRSYMDEDMHNAPAAKMSQAYTITLRQNTVGTMHWELEYRNLDHSYRSLGAPYLESGQKGTSFRCDVTFPGGFLWRGTFGAFHQADGWVSRQESNLTYFSPGGSTLFLNGERASRPYYGYVLQSVSGNSGGTLQLPWLVLSASYGGSYSEYSYRTTSQNLNLSAEIALVGTHLWLNPTFQEYWTANELKTLDESQQTQGLGISLGKEVTHTLTLRYQHLDRRDRVSPGRNMIEDVVTFSYGVHF